MTPTSLTADSPLWAWASDSVVHRLETMLEHVEGVRLGEDIEAVHDMRVGSRRLVAAMRVFAECFPDGEYRRLLREARDVTRRLGAVRDLDVLIDHYEKLRSEASPIEQPGIEYFIALRQRERRRARRPMLRAMNRLEQDGFARRLGVYLQREAELYQVGLDPISIRTHGTELGALAGENTRAIGPFRAAAAAALEPRHEALYAFEPYVAHPEAVEELHEMRIAAKWLRYTMELFAPAYSDQLKRPLSAVKRVQELLGDLHDSDVRLELLRLETSNPLDFRGLEAIGVLQPDPVAAGLRQLLSREERTRQGCYRSFYKEWKKMEARGFRDKSLERLRCPDA